MHTLKRVLGTLFALALFMAQASAQVNGPPMVPSSTGGGGLTIGSPITGTCPNGDVVYSNNGLVGCEVVAGTGTVTSVGWTGGIVSIANPTTVPAFTIAGTSGGIPYFASGSTWASSAALAANAIVIGGGAGAAPSTTTTGLNVLTALGAAINASTGLPNVDGAIVTGNCLKWGPGIQDAGGTCGGGSSTLTVGSTATSGGAAGQLMYDTGSVLTESANLKFTTGLLINGAALPTNAAVALNYSPGANTQTPGDAIINANVAASGLQQEACQLLSGQGWKTSATPASEEVDTQLCTAPIQGAVTPGAGFAVLTQVNGGGYTSRLDYNITLGGDLTASEALNVVGSITTSSNLLLGSNAGVIALGSSSDAIISRRAAAWIQHGAADAAAPVAQSEGVQNVVAGTSNTAGANWTRIASLPTGSGVPGDMIFQTGFQGIAASATITFSDSAAGANTCTVNWTSNGLSANQAFTFSGGTAPTGSTAGTTYYVLTPGTNSFTCSATPGGTILAITTNGSGTITGQTATAQEPPITALTIKGGTQQINFAQPFQTAASSTGAGTETFTNSPCTGLTTEQWVPVKISGQTGTWFVPACQ